MSTIGITREALSEKPEVIIEAMARLGRTADFRNPAPVVLTRCPGHPEQTLSLNQERCFIHLSQEEWGQKRRDSDED